MAVDYESVRKAVNAEWDPIGVAHHVDDEYDSYVPELCELLNRNASAEDVFSFLWTLETEHIGLCGNREATERFAHRLCELRATGAA